MQAKYLREIKETIRQFKQDRPWIKAKVDEIRREYATRLAEYDPNSWLDRRSIEAIKKSQAQAIAGLYDHYGDDAMIHIIYADGTACVCYSDEILAGDVTPKMQHIVYACYADGCQEYDTETGVLTGRWSWETDEELEASEQAREEYFRAIEIKYGTDWGRRHAARMWPALLDR